MAVELPLVSPFRVMFTKRVTLPTADPAVNATVGPEYALTWPNVFERDHAKVAPGETRPSGARRKRIEEVSCPGVDRPRGRDEQGRVQWWNR